MNISAQKALVDALSQHSAYLYRASSQAVNELTAQFNNLSNSQLNRLVDILNELSDSERNALKSLNFSSKAKSSKNIEEIKTILNEWFKSIDVDLFEQFDKSALQLAVYEASYSAKLVAGTAAVVNAEKIYKTIKKAPFQVVLWLIIYLQILQQHYERKLKVQFVMVFHKGRPISRLCNESRGERL